ASPYAFGL
uniref:Carcinustatin-7 n=1 Tax=Carcinus maenas TaxID=6759 RepID=ALL7_CARMA|nr:RecName: Full=Carcinustatin-7; Contains: RecName: Full=Carcinustatin-6; Contains: RecName: Full=Carcinustatin-1 [Carcinus maenas]